MSLSVVRGLMTTAELTLLAIVFGIAVTVGTAVGAAIGGWSGALVGFAAMLATVAVLTFLLRWRRSHQ